MLVCSPEGEPHSPPEEPVVSTGPTVIGISEGKAERKKYNWKHGSKSPLLILADYNDLLHCNSLLTRDLLPGSLNSYF
jgi:hypothetical protein